MSLHSHPRQQIHFRFVEISKYLLALLFGQLKEAEGIGEEGHGVHKAKNIYGDTYANTAQSRGAPEIKVRGIKHKSRGTKRHRRTYCHCRRTSVTEEHTILVFWI